MVLLALAAGVMGMTGQIDGNAPDGVPFTVAAAPWPVDGLGNHRVVIRVDKPGGWVRVRLPWRRHDLRVADKGVVVAPLDSPTQTAPSMVFSATEEVGDIAFDAVAGAGLYALYYLPYRFDLTEGWTDTHYLTRKDTERTDKNAIWDRLPFATPVRFEARSEFDRFAPMELPATATELERLSEQHPEPYWVFPEDRTRPVRMFDRIPALWAARGPSNALVGEARPNEYYVYQLAVCPRTSDLKDVRIDFDDLVGPGGRRIAKNRLTCFNLGGTNWDGSPLHKVVNVA
ncbi:MAG: DUF6067 family protein, partial [Fimbriimonas sp.]|nr:DUF6067 family protein [Fimbriimonas sp.]